MGDADLNKSLGGLETCPRHLHGQRTATDPGRAPKSGPCTGSAAVSVPEEQSHGETHLQGDCCHPVTLCSSHPHPQVMKALQHCNEVNASGVFKSRLVSSGLGARGKATPHPATSGNNPIQLMMSKQLWSVLLSPALSQAVISVECLSIVSFF